MLIHKIPETGNNSDHQYSAVLTANKAAAIVNLLKHYSFTLETLISSVSGEECERCGIRVRLGGNSYPISTMSDVHHRYS
jgi:hypothetical protein